MYKTLVNNKYFIFALLFLISCSPNLQGDYVFLDSDETNLCVLYDQDCIFRYNENNLIKSPYGQNGKTDPPKITGEIKGIFYEIVSISNQGISTLFSSIKIDVNDGSISWSSETEVGKYIITVRAYTVGTDKNKKAYNEQRFKLVIDGIAPNRLDYRDGMAVVTYGDSGHSLVPEINRGVGQVYYSLSGNIPEGVSILNNGQIVWDQVTNLGDHFLTAVASNLKGSFNNGYLLQVIPTRITNFYYHPDQTLVTSGSGQSAIPFINRGVGEVTYSLMEILHNGIEISNNGQIFWDEMVAEGNHRLKVSASNSLGKLETDYVLIIRDGTDGGDGGSGDGTDGGDGGSGDGTGGGDTLEIRAVAPKDFSYTPNRVTNSYGMDGESALPVIDDGGASVSYSLVSNEVANIGIDSATGKISWSEETEVGNYRLTVRADNGVGQVEIPFTLEIQAVAPKDFSYTPNHMTNYYGDDGMSVVPRIYAGGASVSYSLVGDEVTNIGIDSATGKISWSEETEVGNYRLTVRADNGTGQVEIPFTLEIQAVFPKDFSYALNRVTNRYGDGGMSSLPVIDAGGGRVTYSLLGDEVTNIGIDSATGKISWSEEAEVGIYGLVVQADNGGGKVGTIFILEIQAVAPKDFSYTPDHVTNRYGDDGMSVVPRIYVGGASVSYSLVGDEVANIGIDSATGKIFWSEETEVGNYRLTVRADNGTGQVEIPFTLEIQAVAPKDFSYTPNHMTNYYGDDGMSVVPRIYAGGASVSYSLVGDEVTNIGIDSATGKISWSEETEVGNYRLTVRADNGAGQVEIPFTLEIQAVFPKDFSYTPNHVTNGYGDGGMSVVPRIYAGGASVSYSLVGDEVTNIGIDSATGKISWSDQTEVGIYVLVVQADNGGGKVEIPFTLEIQAVAPKDFSYTPDHVTNRYGDGGMSVKPMIDAGGASVSYSLVGDEVANIGIDSATGKISWSEETEVGNYRLTVRADNGTGQVEIPFTLEIQVVAPKDFSYTPNHMTNGYGDGGMSVVPRIYAGGASVSYSLVGDEVANIGIDSATGKIFWSEETEVGNYRLTVQADNGGGKVGTIFILEIQAVAPKDFSYTPNQVTSDYGQEGWSVVPMIDAGGASVSYSLVGNGFKNVSINSVTGVIYWNKKNWSGYRRLTVRASNRMGSVEESYTIKINPVSPDLFSYTPDHVTNGYGDDGMSVVPRIYAGGASVSYSLVGDEVANIGIDSTTGKISWSEETEVGNYRLTVRADNGVGQVEIPFTLEIQAVAPKDFSYTPNHMTNYYGMDGESALPVIDDGGASVSYSLVGDEVANIGIDSAIGKISWSEETEVGNYRLTVRADNGAGQVEIPFTLEIQAVAPKDFSYTPNQVTSDYGQEGWSGLPMIDDGGASVSYSLVGNEVANIGIDSATGKISWSDQTEVENYRLTVRADNGVGKVEIPFTLEIQAVAPKDFSYTPDHVTNGYGDGGMSVKPMIDDGGASVSYSLVSDEVANIGIDSATGKIFWSEETEAGNYRLTVRADNGVGQVEIPFTLEIQAVAPKDFSYTPNHMTNYYGMDGESALPVIDDGGGRVTYSLVGDEVANISIDSTTGKIFWSEETEVGNYRLTVRADNGTGQVEIPFTLEIQAVAPKDFSYTPNHMTNYYGMDGESALPVIDDGGASVSYSLVGDEVANIRIDSATGKISWSEEAEVGFYVLVVQADNGGGKVATIFILEIQAVAPKDFSYTPDHVTNRYGDGGMSVKPMIDDGGASVSYSLVGNGFKNVSINSVTGVIYWNKKNWSGYRRLTVRASNRMGSVEESYTIKINPVSPDLFSYTPDHVTNGYGDDGMSVVPRIYAGGASVSYSLVGNEVANIGIDSATGKIFWSEETEVGNYRLTVQADNDAGQVEIPFTLEIQVVAPKDFSYTPDHVTNRYGDGGMSSLPVIDAGGGRVTYSLVSNEVANIGIDFATGKISWSDQTEVGIYVLVVQADNGGGKVEIPFTLEIQAVAPKDFSYTPNRVTNSYGMDGESALPMIDAGGASVSYSLVGDEVANIGIDSATGKISWSEETEVGNYRLTVRADNGTGQVEIPFTLEIQAVAPKDFSYTPDHVTNRYGDGGMSVKPMIDAGGASVSYSLVSNEVANIRIDSATGKISWSDQTEVGNYRLTVRADNGAGQVEIPFTLEIQAVAPKDFSYTPDHVTNGYGDGGMSVKPRIYAGGGRVTYSLVGDEVANIGIDSATGKISWSEETEVGNYRLTVRADNGTGQVEIPFTLEIQAVAPKDFSYTPDHVTNGYGDGGMSVKPMIDDGGASVSYSLVGDEVANIGIDSATGKISWSDQTEVGIYVLVVQADNGGGKVEIPFTLEIQAVAPKDFSYTPNRVTNSYGMDGESALPMIDAGGASVSYSLVGNEVANIGIDSATGKISWSEETEVGNYRLTVQADNGTGQVEIPFTLEIQAVAPKDFSYTPNQVTSDYGQEGWSGLPMIDAGGASVSYSLVSNGFKNVSINSVTGVIYWNKKNWSGYRRLTVRASNRMGSVEESYTIKINPVSPDLFSYTPDHVTNGYGDDGMSVVPRIYAGGASVSYSLVGNEVANIGIDSATGKIFWSEETEVGNYRLTVQADNDAGQVEIPFTLEIQVVAPKDFSYTPDHVTNRYGDGGMSSLPVIDAGGGRVTYSLVSNEVANIGIDFATGKISWSDQTEVGIYVLVVQADNGGGKVEIPFTLEIQAVAPKDFSYTPNRVTNSYGMDGESALPMIDAGGASVSYSLVGDEVANIGIDSATGKISWSEETEVGNYRLTVRADNGTGQVEIPFTLEIQAVAPKDFSYTPDHVTNRYGDGGMSVKPMIDAGGASVSYSLVSNEVANIRIDSATGKISWSDQTEVGNYRLTVRADNGAGQVEIPFTLEIQAVAPKDFSYTPDHVTNGYGDGGMSVKPMIDDGGASVSYSLVGDEVANIGIDSATGKISWSEETEVGNYRLTVRADNGTGQVEIPFTLEIQAVAPKDFSYTPDHVTNGYGDGGMSVKPMIDDGGASVSYSLVGDEVANIGIDSATGKISWSEETEVGNYRLTVRADNGTGQVEIPFTLEIQAVAPKDFSYTPNHMTNYYGMDGESALPVIDAGGASVSYSLVGNEVANIGIDSATGKISWSEETEVGNYRLTVQADNGLGQVEIPFTLEIQAVAPKDFSYTPNQVTSDYGQEGWSGLPMIDAGGASVSYSLVSNGFKNVSINSVTGVIYWNKKNWSGYRRLTVRASNRMGSVEESYTIKINPVSPDLFSYTPDHVTNGYGDDGMSVVPRIYAGGASVSYSLVGDEVANIGIDSATGKISWSEEAEVGNYRLTVRADNGTGQVEIPFTLEIQAVAPKDFSYTPNHVTNRYGDGGMSVVPVIDAGGASVSYSLVGNGFKNVSINSVTGMIYWNKKNWSGYRRLTVRASNRMGSVEESYTIKINPVSPDLFSYTPDHVTNGYGDGGMSVKPMIDDGGASVSYSLVSDEVANIGIDSATGKIFWSEETEAGNYRLTVRADNGVGQVEIPFTLEIQAVAPKDFSYTPNHMTNYYGMDGESALPVIDDGGGRVTYSLVGDEVANISIDSTTGKIFWSEETEVGNYRLTVRADNGAGQVEIPFTLEIQAVFPKDFSYALNRVTNRYGDGGMSSLPVIDAGGGSVTYSLVGDEVANIRIDSATGKISWSEEAEVGFYVLVVQADNGGGKVATIFILEIQAVAPKDFSYTPDHVTNRYGDGGMSVKPMIDDGGASVSYSLVGNGFKNVSINSVTGVIYWNKKNWSGYRRLTVRASNRMGSVEESYTIKINPVSPDLFSYTPNHVTNGYGDDGMSVVPRIYAGGASVSYSLVGNEVANIGIDSATGKIFWSEETEVGNYRLKVRADNDAGQVEIPFTLEIQVVAPKDFSYTPDHVTNRYGDGGMSVKPMIDDGGASVSYSLVGNEVANIGIDSATGKISWSEETEVGIYRLTVRADNGAEKVEIPFTLEIQAVAPRYFSYTPDHVTNGYGDGGMSVVPRIYAGGASVSYSLVGDEVANIGIDSATGKIFWSEETEVGNYRLTVRADNGVGQVEIPFTLEIQAVAPRYFSYTPDHVTNGYGDGGMSVKPMIDDVGASVSYSLVSNEVANIGIDSATGKISWSDQTEVGIYVLVVQADNGAGQVEIPFTLEIQAVAPKDFSYTPNHMTNYYGMDGESALPVIDSGGASVTYSLVDNEVANIGIDSATGKISWSEETEVGNYRLKVRADNGTGQVEIPFILEIQAVSPKDFSYTPNQVTSDYGQNSWSVVPMIDDGGASVSYSLLDNEFKNISINSVTGVIYWNRKNWSGYRRLTVRASNRMGSVEESYTIKINPVAPDLFSYTPNHVTNGYGDGGMSVVPRIYAGGASVSYSLVSNEVANIGIDSATGKIFWSEETDAGNYGLTVRADNGAGQVEIPFTLEIQAVAPKDFSYTPNQVTSDYGQNSWSVKPMIDDGGASVSYSLVDNEFKNVSINSVTGVIYWNRKNWSGYRRLTVRASNRMGSVEESYTIKINPVSPDLFSYTPDHVTNGYGDDGMSVVPRIYAGGASVSYSLVGNEVANIGIDSATGKIFWSEETEVGNYRLTVQADNDAGQVEIPFTLEIQVVAPKDFSYTPDHVTNRYGDGGMSSLPVIDAGGGRVTYSLVSNEVANIGIDFATGKISWSDQTEVGIYVLVVQADNGGGKVEIPFTLEIQAVAPKDFSYTPNRVTNRYGDGGMSSLPVIDAGGARVTYSLLGDEVANIGIDSATGKISWSKETEVGIYVLVVQADNGGGKVATIFILEIQAVASKDFRYTPDHVTNRYGDGGMSSLPVIDAGGGTVTYSLGGNSSRWITINSNSGIISWSRFISLGTYKLTVIAANNVSRVTTGYTIKIEPTAPNGLVYSPNNKISLYEYEGMSSIPRINSGGAQVTYSLANNGVANIRIDSTTGRISWDKATGIGIYELTVEAKNRYGTVRTSFTLNVLNYLEISYKTPEVEVAYGTSGLTDQPLVMGRNSFDNIVFTISSKAPRNVTIISKGDQEGRVSWRKDTPIGNYQLNITATDGIRHASTLMHFSVRPPLEFYYAPSFKRVPFGSGFRTVANLGINEPSDKMVYSIVGVAPKWVNFDSNGDLIWDKNTPVGSYIVEVKAGIKGNLVSRIIRPVLEVYATAPKFLGYFPDQAEIYNRWKGNSVSPRVDGGGGKLKYNILDGHSEGLGINQDTGVITWDGRGKLRAKKYHLTIGVSNKTGFATANYSLEVKPNALRDFNYSPNFSEGSYLTHGESARPTIKDGGTEVKYSISTGYFEGLKISEITGVLSWGRGERAGTYEFRVRACNKINCIETPYRLKVKPVAPKLFSYPKNNGLVEHGYFGESVRPTVDDGGGAISYSILSGKVDGIEIREAIGVIDWKDYLNPNVYNLRINACNEVACAQAPYRFTIKPTNPRFFSYHPNSVEVFYRESGESVRPTIKDGGGGKLKYNILDGHSEGLGINQDTGVITWGGGGKLRAKKYHLTIGVNNKIGFATANYSLEVKPNALRDFNYSPNFSEGSYLTYGESVRPTIKDGGTEVKYSISTGYFEGLRINEITGVLSWGRGERAGTYEFRVKACNKINCIETPYRLKVKPAAPKLLSYTPSQIEISYGDFGKSVRPTVDNGGGAISYSILSGKVDGIEIGSVVGEIHFWDYLKANVYNLRINACNETACTQSSYRITVKPTDPKYLYYNPDSTEVFYGEYGESVRPFAGDGGGTISYSILSGKVDGIEIGSVSGVIHFRDYLKANVYNLRINACNEVNCIETPYQLRVKPVAPPNPAPPNPAPPNPAPPNPAPPNPAPPNPAPPNPAPPNPAPPNPAPPNPAPPNPAPPNPAPPNPAPPNPAPPNPAPPNPAPPNPAPPNPAPPNPAPPNPAPPNPAPPKQVVKSKVFYYSPNKVEVLYGRSSGSSGKPTVGSGRYMSYSVVNCSCKEIEINRKTGVITWAKNLEIGEYDFSVKATEENGLFKLTRYKIKVKESAPLDFFYSPNNMVAFYNDYHHFDTGKSGEPKVNHGGDADLIYSIVGRFAGTKEIDVNPRTGVIHWTSRYGMLPLKFKTYDLVIRVCNQVGCADTPFKLTAKPSPPKNFEYNGNYGANFIITTHGKSGTSGHPTIDDGAGNKFIASSLYSQTTPSIRTKFKNSRSKLNFKLSSISGKEYKGKGIRIEPDTGLIKWDGGETLQPDTYNLKVKACNQSGCAESPYTLKILKPSLEYYVPPVITIWPEHVKPTNPSIESFIGEVSYFFTFKNGCPPGMGYISEGKDAGKIFWNLEKIPPGDYFITVDASDGKHQAQTSFTLKFR